MAQPLQYRRLPLPPYFRVVGGGVHGEGPPDLATAGQGAWTFEHHGRARAQRSLSQCRVAVGNPFIQFRRRKQSRIYILDHVQKSRHTRRVHCRDPFTPIIVGDTAL